MARSVPGNSQINHRRVGGADGDTSNRPVWQPGGDVIPSLAAVRRYHRTAIARSGIDDPVVTAGNCYRTQRIGSAFCLVKIAAGCHPCGSRTVVADPLGRIVTVLAAKQPPGACIDLVVDAVADDRRIKGDACPY